jgi:hypothetical protein
MLHYMRDRRVVAMADAREQVVFDLEIESAHKPGQEPTGPTEIHRRFHLVFGP